MVEKNDAEEFLQSVSGYKLPMLHEYKVSLLQEPRRCLNIESGVYFLFNDNELLYVGETTAIGKRISKHLYNGLEIKQVFYYKISSNKKRCEFENFFIEQFHPKYNGSCNGLPSQIEEIYDNVIDKLSELIKEFEDKKKRGFE